VTALSIISLSKSFCAGTAGCAARVSVLRDLDLALWPGEIVALQGAVASGRSTLLKCAAGLLKPDSGSIFWYGARVVLRDAVAYVSAGASAPAAHPSRELSSNRRECGALYAALNAALARGARLLLIDDLPFAGAFERRLVLSLLQRHALAGAAILFAANEELATTPVVPRVVTLADGALIQRRKRSAARIAASSRASRARVSASSTYGRSLRSPQ
jgi:ABC-type sulfate/molybdate transport systems ATPase subunit